MKQLIDKIIRPQRNQLIVFAVLVSPAVLLVVYNSAMMFMIGDSFLQAFGMLLAFVFVVAFLFDWNYKTKLKSYVMVTAFLLVAFVILSKYAESFLKRKAEEQGAILGELIEDYKIRFGKYPESLEAEFFIDSPKRSFVGTEFYTEISFETHNKDTVCYVKFKFFDGYTASYNSKEKKWHYYD
ncbi:MAG TPA: hypothetical protein VGC65_07860 [Bacteroidia bacterium]|jgi:hypothetical protein